MTRFIRSALFTAIVCLPQFVRAADASPDAVAAVSPYLDEQTIAVIRVDLSRIDPGAVLDKWVEIVPGAKRAADELRPQASALRTGFTSAGFQEIYVIVSLADVPVHPPVIVAPLTDRGGAIRLPGSLVGPFWDNLGMKLAVRGDALVLAAPATLERLKSLKPAPREELAAAFATAGDHAIQILVLPTNNDRRVIEELMPTLPAIVGGQPSKVVTHGVQWLALGVDSPPHAAFSVTVQSAGADAANNLAAAWGQAATALAASSDPRLPPLAAALKLFSPVREDSRLVVKFGEAEFAALLAAARRPLEDLHLATMRRASATNLKRLGLGLLNFESANERFPAAATYDAAGQPLLSWRVHVLPFMEFQDLYKKFHLNEPWDSAHNKQLIAEMPDVFRSPMSKHRASDGLATYREVAGPKTMFGSREGITIKQVLDGTSQTVAIVDVDDDHAVIWTKPESFELDADHPRTGMGGQFPDGIHAEFIDGHYKLLTPEKVNDATLRALLTIDGGETVDP